MAFLKKLFGGSAASDALALRILMNYSVRLERGIAAIDFADPLGVPESVKANLVALLYGRILCVHRETTEELFHRVDEIARENVRTEGATGFAFKPWLVEVAGSQTIWPWTITEASELTDAKVYTATLKVGNPTSLAPSGRWIHLDMTLGLERVLAPSSALIAISGLSESTDQESRYYLALLLWQMHEYWRVPARVTPNSEAQAYAAASTAIRSGQLTVP